MRDTVTLDRELNDEIDYESFINAEQKEDQITGLVKLLSIEETFETQDHKSGDDIVFKCKMLREEQELRIVADEDDMEFIHRWTGTSNDNREVTELAGENIPITIDKDGQHSLCKFPELRNKGLTVEDIRDLESKRAIEFSNGSWGMSDAWVQHNRIVGHIQTGLSLLSILSAILGLYSVLFHSFGVWITIMLFWFLTVFVNDMLGDRISKRPINSILRKTRKS